MNREQCSEIKQAIIEILKEYDIKSSEDFDTMDEYTGCVLYENLKAGVLEEFDLNDDEMGEMLDEVLEKYQI